MNGTISIVESELLQKFRLLSEEKQREALDFISFILDKVSNRQEQQHEPLYTPSVVDKTWGTLALEDRELIKYIAEDKELEYDV